MSPVCFRSVFDKNVETWLTADEIKKSYRRLASALANSDRQRLPAFGPKTIRKVIRTSNELARD
jgi:hypothetical protein